MEFRLVKVGGWEFQFQVLPEFAFIAVRPVGDEDKRIDSKLAHALALEILND